MIKQAWCNTKYVCSNSKEDNAEYYHIDWNKLNELGFDENESGVESFSTQVKAVLFGSQTAKLVLGGGTVFGGIVATGACVAIGFIYYATDIEYVFPLKTMNPDGTELIISSFKELLNNDENTDWLIPITKEDYYNIDGLKPV